MKIRISRLLELLHTSFWFIPTLMLVGAFALSIATLMIDSSTQHFTSAIFGYSRGTDGARSLLTSIATSVISVAGVTFSITISALTQASAQFGSRVLRSFMRDTGNQIVLGTFVATFLYCILILRTISSSSNATFIPHISIMTGILLSTASLCVLIYFIHHISTSLQANNVLAAAAYDLNASIEKLFPKSSTDEQNSSNADSQQEHFEQDAYTVVAKKSGYLQNVEIDRLVNLASKKNIIIRLECQPGDFVFQESKLALVWPSSHYDDELHKKFPKMYIIGKQRSQTQDIGFSINGVAEVGVRAISSGDPYTALVCIDWLSSALQKIGERSLMPTSHYDAEHHLRVIMPCITFDQLVSNFFEYFRQAAQNNILVTQHLLESIEFIIEQSDNVDLRIALLNYTSNIAKPQKS